MRILAGVLCALSLAGMFLGIFASRIWWAQAQSPIH